MSFVGSRRRTMGELAGRIGLELVAVEPEVEPSWQERALCAQTDPEAFFPEKGGSTRDAKKVCLANDERFGIWGGLSERERRRLKRAAAAG
jgi:WhiB family redox-sensing transcriptional regulator